MGEMGNGEKSDRPYFNDRSSDSLIDSVVTKENAFLVPYAVEEVRWFTYYYREVTYHFLFLPGRKTSKERVD